MSFGFSVSDFVTVADLARKLHRDVICVARKAPEELSSLSKELGALSTVLTTLKEDALNPSSALAKSGPDRVTTATSAVQFTGETLQKLEQLKDKYGLLDAADRSKAKRMWDRVKFAKDLPNINNLRSKLNYHYNIITLLLVAGANSSLERIEATQNDEAKNFATILESLEKISLEQSQTKTLPRTMAPPIFSGVAGESMQYTLSQMFIEKAELQGSWLTIGLDVWLQAGRWWLFRYLSWKASTLSARLPIPTQTYVDLLKAAWIMIDVVKEHPQRDYIMSGTQQITIRETTEVVAQELSNLNQSLRTLPSLEEISAADLNVFASVNSTNLDLSSGTLNASGRLRARGYVILFQRVGIWRPSHRRDAVEGLILVLWNKETRALRLRVQHQSGRDIIDFDFKYIIRFQISAREEETRTSNTTNHSAIYGASSGMPFAMDYSLSDKTYSWSKGKFASYADEQDYHQPVETRNVEAQEIILELYSSQDVLQFYLLLTTLQLYRLHFSCSHDTVNLPLFCDIGLMVAITALKWDLEGTLHLLATHAYAADMSNIRTQCDNLPGTATDYGSCFHDIAFLHAQRTLIFQPADKLFDPDVYPLKETPFVIRSTSKIQPRLSHPSTEYNLLKQAWATSVLYDFLLEAREHTPNACTIFAASMRLRSICTVILVAELASVNLDSEMASELLGTLFSKLSEDNGKRSFALITVCNRLRSLHDKTTKGHQLNQTRRKGHLRCFLDALPDTIRGFLCFNYPEPQRVAKPSPGESIDDVAVRSSSNLQEILKALQQAELADRLESKDGVPVRPIKLFRGITTCPISSVKLAEILLQVALGSKCPEYNDCCSTSSSTMIEEILEEAYKNRYPNWVSGFDSFWTRDDVDVDSRIDLRNYTEPQPTDR